MEQMANHPDTGYSFESLPYPVRSFGNLKHARYHIYTSRTEFVTVEAETATDALRAAKISNPHRIVRDIPGREVLLDRQRVLAELNAQASASAPAAEAAAPASPN